jgi:hypothetical protein
MLSFLFKAAIVFVVLMVVIANVPPAADRGPSPGESAPAGTLADARHDPATAGATPGETTGPADLVTVLGAALSDAAGFCERQPDACERAGAAIADLGPRVVSLVETVAVTALSPGAESAASAPPAGGSAGPDAAPPSTEAPVTGTLTAEDAATEWSLEPVR